MTGATPGKEKGKPGSRAKLGERARSLSRRPSCDGLQHASAKKKLLAVANPTGSPVACGLVHPDNCYT